MNSFDRLYIKRLGKSGSVAFEETKENKDSDSDLLLTDGGTRRPSGCLLGQSKAGEAGGGAGGGRGGGEEQFRGETISKKDVH